MIDVGDRVSVVRRTSIRTHLGIKRFTDDGGAILAGFGIIEEGEAGVVCGKRESDQALIVRLDGREQPVFLMPHSVEKA
jgi:hypothetical protein